MMNVPGFSVLQNTATVAAQDAWVTRAIQARQSVYLASNVVRSNLVDEAGNLTRFGHELAMLMQASYVRAGNMLLPPN